MTKNETKFLNELIKIKDPTIYLGIARILKVDLLDKENNPRDFYETCADVLTEYKNASRARRQEILTILTKANKEISKNANRTKNTQKAISNKEM